MSKSDEQKRRDERLAEKLRENLKRRKGQARARRQEAGAADEKAKPAKGEKQ